MKNTTTTQLITTMFIMMLPFLISAQITSYPYEESFEGDPASFTWDNLVPNANSCGPWEYGSNTGTNNTGPSYASDQSNFIYIDANNCTQGEVSYTTSDLFSFVGLRQPTFTFDLFRYGSNNLGFLNVEISEDGGINWVVLETFNQNLQNSDSDPWSPISVDLSTYRNKEVLLRFGGEDKAGNFKSDIAIDNIVIYDAGIINGNADVTYEYDEAGNRTMRLYTITSMAQSEQQLMAASRSIEDGKQLDIVEEELFKVFPNPASHFINIESTNIGEPATIYLLDAAGRELLATYLSDEALQIDMSGYQSGVYVLWIQSDDKVVTKKVIKH